MKQNLRMEKILHSLFFPLLSAIRAEGKILFIFLFSMILPIEINKRKMVK